MRRSILYDKRLRTAIERSEYSLRHIGIVCKECGVPAKTFWKWLFKYVLRIEERGPTALRRENAMLRRRIRELQHPSRN